MLTFIATLHIIACLTLILFVVIQNPKGGALGVFGGQSSSSKSVFASTGASDFLISVTKWCAITFAITSISIAYINSNKNSSIILDQPITETSSSSPKSSKVPSQTESKSSNKPSPKSN